MTNLITLDTYKEAKAIVKNDYNNRLDLLISSVSQLVKTYCGTSFVDYVETDKIEPITINTKYTNAILLDESPIISITSIEERSSETDPYVILTHEEDYSLDSSSDMIYRLGAYWPNGINSVRVNYKAGYTEVPGDLQLAVIDIVTYYFKEEHKKQQSIGQNVKQNQGTSSRSVSVDFPDHIKRVLNLYRQIV